MQPVGAAVDPEVDELERRGVVGARFVLVFLAKGVVVDGADAHEPVQATHLGPTEHCARVHGGFVGLVKGLCIGFKLHLFIVGAGAGVELLPLFPQAHVVGPLHDGPEHAPPPARRAGHAVDGRVVVQAGADPEHIHAAHGRCQAEHAGRDELLGFVAARLGAHMLVVFQVVQKNQVGPVGAVLHTAQLFAGAADADFDVARGDGGGGLPHPALAHGIGEVLRQARVGVQLGLDAFEHFGALLFGVHDDDHQVLAGLFGYALLDAHIVQPLGAADGPQRAQLGFVGGLGLATRGHVHLAAIGLGVDHLGQALEDELLEQRKMRRGHVVREVGLAEKLVIHHGPFAALTACGRVGVEGLALQLNLLAQVFTQPGEFLLKLFPVAHLFNVGALAFSHVACPAAPQWRQG